MMRRLQDGPDTASLNPATPLCFVEEVLPEADYVLLMTVNPGYAGQTLVEGTLPKIADLAARRRAEGRDLILQVDGNVSFENGRRIAAAGATAFVAGSSSVFAPGVSRAEATRRLREAIEAGARSVPSP
jgi:ribulose-phosphate 3-epimerase